MTIQVENIQHTLQEHELDGWLLYDCHGSNSLAYQFLHLPHRFLSRRFLYWIPRSGLCLKIVPSIEPYTLDHLPGEKKLYRTWQELQALMQACLANCRKIAMEYSPYNELPAISKVDAGTIETIRRMGVEVVSSADLLQKHMCVWTTEQRDSHIKAAQFLEEIADQAWDFIRQSLHAQCSITEYDVQQFLLNQMKEGGFITADPPICAVNQHSADPHYSPEAKTSTVIRKGDFILLDIWCKQNRTQAVYADMTRVAVAAEEPTPLQSKIFAIVNEARCVATEFVKNHYQQGKALAGWEVDRVCRDVIEKAGYGESFIHRTGHNLGEDVHGSGANLDDFETHDSRLLLPGIAFTIEPGIYLPQQFGIRLEYDVYLHPEGFIEITGGIQNTIECLFINK